MSMYYTVTDEVKAAAEKLAADQAAFFASGGKVDRVDILTREDGYGNKLQRESRIASSKRRNR